jgi:hypothetical protein
MDARTEPSILLIPGEVQCTCGSAAGPLDLFRLPWMENSLFIFSKHFRIVSRPRARSQYVGEPPLALVGPYAAGTESVEAA